MKTIKFRSQLIPEILNGSKTSTWRLFDDKNLQSGDEVQLINWETGEMFATARLTDIHEKTLGEVTNEDFNGHAPYINADAMLADFRQYYSNRVTLQSRVKIIQFEMNRKSISKSRRPTTTK